MPVPKLSYTIWFSQRTGSTWFCELLASTGMAGRPGEYLSQASPEEALRRYEASDARALLETIHRLGTSENGVFGIKQGYCEPSFGRMLDLVASPSRDGEVSRLDRWQRAFPNHRHIFMTRRNKVRLAVSWWRAIQSGEWHRRKGAMADPSDIEDRYNAHAIDRLMQEAVFREAGIQELFLEAGVMPLTITYEDAIRDSGGCLNQTLDFLGLPHQPDAAVSAMTVEKTSDALSERWVQRFRRDRQDGWVNLGW